MMPAIVGAGAAFNWHGFIVQALGFGILAAILVKFVVPTLKKMSGDRTKGIEDRFTRLDQDIADSSRELADYKEKLRRIDEESRRRIQAAQEEGTRTRASLLAEAQQQAQADLEKARREIQVERDKAVLELRAAVTEMTVAATEKLIDAAMNEELHGRIVDRSLGELGRVVKK